MKDKLLLLITVFAIIVITGCGGRTIDGTYTWNAGKQNSVSIEFFSDGSCITTFIILGGVASKTDGKYAVSGDSITKTTSEGKEIKYTLSSEAVMIDEKGDKYFKQ
tara:strand:+ start:144 stop:461 length:318 start_codon:yes stop_codon:yes gene_type:complete